MGIAVVTGASSGLGAEFARQLQHDPEVEEVTILYTDLRAFGKGFDDFVQRSRDEKSANYVRGRPAKIELVPEDDTLEVFVEDTLGHQQQRIPADLVVLSVAAAPNDGAIRLAEMLGIETDAYGFIARRDPAISAVESTRDGIFVCGMAHSPKSIEESISQAKAAVSRACTILAKDTIEAEGIVATVNSNRCTACELCMQVCAYNAIEIEETKRGKTAKVNSALCKGCGACAATCRCSAIDIKGFTDQQISSAIAALG